MDEIILEGEIGWWGITAEDVQYELDKCSGDVTIKLSSGGGSVFEGILIYNKIKSYSKGEVTIINTGICASMASYILLAGDIAKCYDNSTIMIHNALTFIYGNHNDLRDTADVLEGLSALLRKRYVSKSGISDEEIQMAMDKESYYFGSEALDFGLVDEIISTEEELDESVALAFAKESYKAVNNSYAKHAMDEKEIAVAVAYKKGNKLEKAKPTLTPTKKEAKVDMEKVEALASKVRGIKARLTLKDKGFRNG